MRICRPVPFAVLTVFFAVAIAPAASSPEGLGHLLEGVSRPPLDDETVRPLARWADTRYEALFTVGGLASIDLFVAWIDLAEYFQRDSIAARNADDEAATAVSDRVFRETLVRWGGFHRLLSGGQTRRLRRAYERFCAGATGSCPDERATIDAARMHLLHRLSVHRAYLVFRGLGHGSHLGADPRFWDAYERLVPLARSFGLLSARDAYVHAGLVEGQAQLDRTRRGLRHDEHDPAAALANVHEARWELERAAAEFADGHDARGMVLVHRGVDSLHHGREFGAARLTLRSVLDPFRERLGSEESIATVDGVRLSFRGTVETAIAAGRETTQAPLARNVTIPMPAAAPWDAAPPRAVPPDETVSVTAAPGKFNPDLYIHEELAALVAQASGLPAIDRHENLKRIAPLLYHGLLREIVNDGGYDDLRSIYLGELTGKRRKEARDGFVSLGSIVVANPDVMDALYRSGNARPVKNRIRFVDSPELYSDVGDLYAADAKALRAAAGDQVAGERSATLARAIDRSRRAHLDYLESARRLEPGRVPPELLLNAGASAQNVLVACDRAAHERRGPAVDASLSWCDDERTALIRAVEDAYGEVVRRGPGNRDRGAAADRRYANWVHAVARLSRFERVAADSRDAARYRTLLDESVPANGFQFYARADALATALHDSAAARRDFGRAVKAFAAVLAEPNALTPDEYRRALASSRLARQRADALATPP